MFSNIKCYIFINLNMSLEAMRLGNDHEWLLKTRWKIGNPITDQVKAENN